MATMPLMQQAARKSSPEQPAASGGFKEPDVTSMIPPELRDIVERVHAAGLKIMTAPEMRDEVQQGIQSPDPVPQKLAQNVTGLLLTLDKKSAELTKLETERKELEEKLKTIATLEAKKVGPVNVLADLSDAAPEQVWLLEFKESGGLATISGLGLDDQTIADTLDWYRTRWEIELFFLVLKEGCRVERLQLADTDRLQTALALYMVIAWRINRLMRLGRTLPDLPADLVFEADEWRAAFILNKKPIPKTVPPLNTVLRLVAQRGGFLARRHDGEPGAKTIWLGLQEIAVFVEGARYARQFGEA